MALPTDTALLTVTDLALYFGGLKAVDGVSFSVRHGEIFAIIGPNGAGKTTIFNMVSRIYAPTKGTIDLEGEELTLLPSHSLPSLGVARTFQNIELFAGATVLSNILLGCQVHRRTGLISELLFTPRVSRQEIAFRDRVENIIAFLDLGAYRHVEVASLPYGIRKTVELARALAIGPKLLLLDEPSSGLNAEETHHVSELILGIRERFGTAVVMVEHDMNLVNNISDRVLALVAGRVLAEGTPEQIRNNEAVKTAYLGDS
jgi:branched-chain amino acid transport system ATP-binding protein